MAKFREVGFLRNPYFNGDWIQKVVAAFRSLRMAVASFEKRTLHRLLCELNPQRATLSMERISTDRGVSNLDYLSTRRIDDQFRLDTTSKAGCQ